MLKIKKATRADISIINTLAQQVFPETYKNIITPAQIEFMMNWMYAPENIEKQMNEGHTYLIAYNGGAPCGYVSVNQENENLFHLQKIYVLPQNQGIGAGKFLFDEAVKYIKSKHSAPCTLELNVNRHNKAVSFYKHLGMHVARQGDFDIGNGFFMNDYIMAIEI